MTAATLHLFKQPDHGASRPPAEGIAGEVESMVIDDIKRAAASAPRSLQTAPGPSELGTPCIRRLAYKILDNIRPLDKPNMDTDPWAATIGTSVHHWMAGVYEAENAKLAGTPAHDRYLIEHRISLPYGIAGSCDLFDRDTGRVIDWKVTGLDNIKKYRKNGPGDSYRKQAHLYALGLQLTGETVRDVVIVFLPRGGRIDGLYVWTEPYLPKLAVATLQRYDRTRQALIEVDPEQYPDRWSLFATGDAYCNYCPMFLPGSRDLSSGCPGHNPK